MSSSLCSDSVICADERNEWMKQVQINGNIDVCIYLGCLAVCYYLNVDDGKPERAGIQ